MISQTLLYFPGLSPPSIFQSKIKTPTRYKSNIWTLCKAKFSDIASNDIYNVSDHTTPPCEPQTSHLTLLPGFG